MRPRYTVTATLLRVVDGTERDTETNRPERTIQRVPIVVSAPQPTTSVESAEGGGSQRQAWDLFVWSDTTITKSDQIEIDGLTYEVDGDPGVFRRGACFHHQEAVITRSR